HTMLFFGDIHLANRTNDRKQFAEFVSDVNSYLSTVSGPVYAMTLGDMTWDQYWYSNSYEFAQYLADVNGIKGLSIFHTIGNHDHDMNATGDWFTVVKYKEKLCPNYFSFNVGNVHYVSVDNILCENTAASTTDPDVRQYSEKVAPEVIDWLKKDLSFVDKSMHIVATAHASIYYQNGVATLKNASEFVSCFEGYDVDIVTGHTHKIWNVDKRSTQRVYEHNSGAICATWWWAGYYTPTLNIAQDGAPGGWRIAKVNGTEFDWQFKGTQRDAGYQFRTYDRNRINITASEFAPSANETYAAAFNALVAACGWNGSSSDNEVYINIWDYDPSWTITVTEKETGSTLQASRVTTYDPLYLIAYSAKRYNVNKNPTFSPFATNHIFKVKASSATSTLDITVKDPYGRTYKQTMTRPKNFSLSVYANE
ncbi:MAG: calcineurin-like phosphoesterase C-terminal domain-containing protein, partial [Candidatus Cryptobacteroides sp.]